MDQLQSMAVFVRVVERGNFTAAAGDFRISGTMVGQHIRGLEGRLGGRLLNRTTRRQSLTELGRLYYDRCLRILSEVAEADSLGSEMSGHPRGLLRVMTPVSFGVHLVAPACKDYLLQHPDVEIELVVSDRPIDMVEQAFDIVVRIGELPDSTMKSRALFPYRSIICASPAYLETNGTPKRAADLAKHRCLGFAHPTASRRWRLSGPEGEEIVPVSLVLSANNGEALRMAALSGLGIIMQPEILLADDVSAGRLVPILTDHKLPPRPMHLLLHPDRRPSAKVRTFAAFLVGRFGRGYMRQKRTSTP